MKRYFLKGFCNKDRTAGIREIEQIISKHGFVVDFKMFSDIALSLVVEIEEQKVNGLYADLTEYMGMSDFDGLNSESDTECTLMINVTFTKGTGNLKIDVPASG